MDYSPEYEQVSIADFDTLARKKKFSDGPHISTFGDGYGEPYQPERPVWGQLKDGRKIRSIKHFGEKS